MPDCILCVFIYSHTTYFLYISICTFSMPFSMQFSMSFERVAGGIFQNANIVLTILK